MSKIQKPNSDADLSSTLYILSFVFTQKSHKWTEKASSYLNGIQNQHKQKQNNPQYVQHQQTRKHGDKNKFPKHVGRVHKWFKYGNYGYIDDICDGARYVA